MSRAQEHAEWQVTYQCWDDMTPTVTTWATLEEAEKFYETCLRDEEGRGNGTRAQLVRREIVTTLLKDEGTPRRSRIKRKKVHW